MAAVRSKNTTPERLLRSALHAAGVRYRLGQDVVVAGRKVRPDLVFRRVRLAVFVDGCFWHGCPDHCRMPNTNRDYWTPKIDRNRARDQNTDDVLRSAGWTVVRVWEHEDASVAAARVSDLLAERRARRAP
jgi:DNA mismatch endonuclease, patch repair protein